MEEILVCKCFSCEHIIVVRSIDEDKDNEVFMTIHLAPHPWYKRVINGIKYIFGHRSVYGEFDEFIFDKRHVPTLKRIIKELEK